MVLGDNRTIFRLGDFILSKNIILEAINIAKMNGYKPPYLTPLHDFDILYSHDFARAFWGVDPICGRCGGGIYRTECIECGADDITAAYVYHLAEMVRQLEPRDYLEPFVYSYMQSIPLAGDD